MRKLYLGNGDKQFKFADTTTEIHLNAFDDGSEATLTADAKVRIKNDSGYLLGISASITNNHAVITSGQLAQLPVGSYLLELWDTVDGGTAIYPSDGFLALKINENVTGISGGLVSSITVDDFIQQFSDLSQQLKQEVSDAVANGVKGDTGPTGPKGDPGDGSPQFIDNLAALQTKYPTGTTGLFVTLDTGLRYVYVEGAWKDFGVYQSVGIAEKSLTAPMTNFLIKASILTDDIPVKTDKSLKSNIGLGFDGALLDNLDNIVWYKVPVTGGRSYSAYYHNMPKLPTQLVIMEFQNGASTKRYSVPGDNPTFIVDTATDYVHISLASSKADYNAVKIILSEASSHIGKNSVETDNGWEARLTKAESEIGNLTDKYLNRIKSGNSFVKSIGGFLPLSIANVSPDVSGSVNLSNKQRFADNSVMINSIYSSNSGRFKIDLGGTRSFEDLTLVFFAPVETSPDVTVKCSVSQDGTYSDALPATALNGKYSTGWNYVKLTPGMLKGLPTTAAAIYLTITSRDIKTDGEIYGTLYLDSIIFDLRQTPVVCLSLDQLHQESFDNGAYQYLLNSGLPFSLYCRGWDDTSLVSAEWLDWAKNAEYNYGAELGVYGSYGEAQGAVNGATDYDSAKVNLAASWSAFFKTFGHAPATYAAAQAFTSEFSLRAAKDVGFKIVRGGQLNMLNAYLDKDTVQLPMTSLSYDTDADNIKNKIDNAIKYGYQLNLFTHGAYDTASASDYLKLADFKSMIDYLAEQRALGKLKVLTIDDYVTQAIEGVF